ncbi:MAG: hypothetical protein P8174_03730 [Gemmatimonadota bacterium]
MNGKTAAPKDVRIEIQLQGQKITTTPDRPHVRKGDTVVWVCDHPWAVAFDGRGSVRGPFADNDPDRRHNEEKDSHIRGNQGKEAVSYKYAVAVCAGNDVYVADPEVIVDPDPE